MSLNSSANHKIVIVWKLIESLISGLESCHFERLDRVKSQAEFPLLVMDSRQLGRPKSKAPLQMFPPSAKKVDS